ncbi:MAG: transglutaminase-like domain-containing protein [Nitrospirota bacterium]
MMDFRFSRSTKIISSIVLFFFCWSFGGIFDIVAFAATDNKQPAVISKQLTNQPSSQAQTTPQKPEEKFQKAIDDITQIVSDTSTDTDTKKNKAKGKKSEIETLDVEIKKQFNGTEKFLKEKGLPPDILDRHNNFVKHYDNNLKELNNNLDAIDKAKDKKEADDAIEKTKKFLEKVKPSKKHKKLDPNRLPHSTPEVKEFEIEEKKPDDKKSPDLFKKNADIKKSESPILIASAGSLDGLLAQAQDEPPTTRNTPPTEADLAETLEIKFTPEIQAKVAEIGTSPVKLYEYVRNHFTYEPYYGSLKGSQQTLLEMAGNDIDQASVLIALLRSANVPARYACGTIELSMDDLKNWLGGVKDSMTAAQIMATNGIPGTLLTEGGTIKYAQFDHCWVEAYVDMFPSMGSVNKQGKYWTPVDPSMKEMKISESIDLSKIVPFDEENYINSGDTMSPVLSYIYNLKDYYDTNYDDSFVKIFHVAIKKKQEFGIFLGTLPYKVISEQRHSEIPDTKRHKIRLGLSTGINEGVYIEKTLSEIAGKKITISYSPATPNDQEVINHYGGLLNTPVYLINVKAEIKLNDTTILSGPEMTMGSALSLTTEISSPNLRKSLLTTDITHGLSYAIGIPLLDYSGSQLVGQIDLLSNLEGRLHDSINAMDSRANELLHNIAIEYFSQLNGLSKPIESIMHVHNTKLPSIALVSADAGYNYIFNIPLTPPIMEGLSIDAIHIASSPISLDGDMVKKRDFIKHRGLNSSYLEHKIIENLLEEEAISAVKALQIAAQNGIPIYTITNSNIDSIMPILTISNDDKEDIRNAINAGKEVIVSRDNITLFDWTGVGYIVRDPNTGSGSYMISGSLNGSGTVKSSNPEFDKEQKFAWFVVGKPIGAYFDEYWWNYVAGYVVEMMSLPIWQKYGYIRDCVFEANKGRFLIASNHPDTWILHYSGHSGYNVIQPAKGESEKVYTMDIKVTDINGQTRNQDAKIVFLNGCYVGAPNTEGSNAFAEAFGVTDQKLVLSENEKIDRKEVLLGWEGMNWMGDMIALEFWMLMGQGKTVQQAIDYIKAKYPDLPWASDDIKFYPVAGGETTLIP